MDPLGHDGSRDVDKTRPGDPGVGHPTLRLTTTHSLPQPTMHGQLGQQPKSAETQTNDNRKRLELPKPQDAETARGV